MSFKQRTLGSEHMEKTMIDKTNFRWPIISEDEIDAVTRVLRSGHVNYWTGEECRLFEKEYSSFVGTKYSVALANGTLALETALHALNIGPGDEVVVPSRTFIATASCVVMRGAHPVIADIDPDSQNITVDTLREVITSKTKAVIVVHLAGWPCNMDPILEFAKDHGLYVIEDCAQAQGARYKGRCVGSFGEVAVFSFCQDKIMTTGGEGGMLTTNNKDIWEKAWSFKDHGKNYDVVHQNDHAPGFRWLHESFGTNGRMTEMQAVIGRVQLRKVPAWIQARRRNAEKLNSYFLKIPALRVPMPSSDYAHSYYKYYAFVRQEALKQGWDRDRIMNSIEQGGVPCQTGSCSEIYLEKAFQRMGLQPKARLKVARELGETSLMFLVHPTLTDDEMAFVNGVVQKVMMKATR